MSGPIRKLVPKDPFERWNLLGLSELSEPLPPIPWVCQSLRLAPGAVTLVAGYGYSRKTMALQSLALSVASGRPAWGVWSVRQGPVVHLDYEQGRRLTQERYQRLARGMGYELPELPTGSLRVGVMPRTYLDDASSADELARIVDGAACVLIDSLRAAFPRADENSSDVRTRLDTLSRVSERTGAAIIVIHHARKPNAANGGTATHAIRGSSSLFDACQSVYVFEGAKDTPTTVHHEKDRIMGSTLDDFGVTSEDIPGPTGPRHGLRVVHLEPEQMAEREAAASRTKERASLDKHGQAILETMARFAGHFRGSKEAFRAACGIHKPSFLRALGELMAAGVVVQEGTYHAPSWRFADEL